jgi:UPF0716 protein FxsA
MMPFLITMLVPAEVLLLSWVAHRIGWGPVGLACLVGIVAGQALLRWRGRVFLREAQAAVQRDQMPHEALIGGIAWYVAGILLIVPGFITDVLALIIMLPPVRRRVLARFGKAAEARIMSMGGTPGGFTPPGNVYEGEVSPVDEHDPRSGEHDTGGPAAGEPEPDQQVGEQPRLPGDSRRPD